MNEQILKIDVSKLSPRHKEKLFEKVREYFDWAIRDINDDLHFYNIEGEAYKALKGWKNATKEQRNKVIDQYVEIRKSW